MKKVFVAFKEVYHFKNSFMITLTVALVLFLFNLLVNNYRLLFSDFSFLLLFSLFFGMFTSMNPFSLLILFIISFLTGIVVTMILFLIKRQIEGNYTASLSSLFFGLLAPSCPSCAMGLLSLLGFGGFLALLPFKGLELGVIAIGLLGASIVYLSKKITTTTCRLD